MHLLKSIDEIVMQALNEDIGTFLSGNIEEPVST